MTPGLLLAVLLMGIGAQATHVVAPGRARAWLTLPAATVGVIGAEVVALGGHGGPSLGVVHPVADLVGILACEVGAVVALPRRSRRR